MENTPIAGAPLLGMEVAAFKSLDHAVAQIYPYDRHIPPGFLVAINAEKIVRAYYDEAERELLLSATLRYPDGMGAVLAMLMRGCKTARIPGADLWYSIMERASHKGDKVFLLGGAPGVVEEVSHKLGDVFPGINIVGISDGYFIDEDQMINLIQMAHANIVTVAMGSPKQEKFIMKCRSAMPDVFFMGVGGTYDVFAGKVKRAPKIWQSLGLEWLYRLICQPTRIKRQSNLLHFIILLLLRKI